MKIIFGILLSGIFILSVNGHFSQVTDISFKGNTVFTGSVKLMNGTALVAQSEDNRCTVADPAGTHLSVRSNPDGGRIIRRLKNGMTVYAVYSMNDTKNRSWSKFSLSNKDNAPIIGWVLTQALKCS